MPDSTQAFVLEAQLKLGQDADPGAIGAAVTTELCGHWAHEGRCRWPHNNAIEAVAGRFTFRTLVIAQQCDRMEVLKRIEAALRSCADCDVISVDERDVAHEEAGLARRLAAP
jgi:hypothetical protein